MPQKHPPARTAVSSPAFCAGASAAGGGMVTADSACAASGAKARTAPRRRAVAFMVMVPNVVLSLIYERIWLKAAHKVTRLREKDVYSRERHGRACPGHPRLTSGKPQDVDARHKAGRDI